MSKSGIVSFVFFLLLAVSAPSSHASISWDWSFGTNSGQFTTTGTAIGNVASAGTYSVTNFAVTSSGTGATIGSLLGGQYDDSDSLVTNLPYSLVWDGSVVTSWIHSGSSGFDWLVFDDLSNSNYFFFGYETGNINTAMQAAYFPYSETSSTLSINVSSVAAIPEPEIYAMMGLGLGLIGWARRRKPAA